MKVLKELISRESEDLDEDARDIEHRLQCIVTAFELLSGQGVCCLNDESPCLVITIKKNPGEALNIDLSDFINRLYAVILPLSLMQPPPTDMLFRALDIVFSPRTTSGSVGPPWRSAAFAKRLLTASLHWPPEAALQAIEFVGGLVAKDAKLEVLLSTEDRMYDGVYRADIDDPQVCNPFGTSFWELHMLYGRHWHSGVRTEAGKLIRFIRS